MLKQIYASIKHRGNQTEYLKFILRSNTERDLLVESNWDWEVLCECSDEGNNWVLYGLGVSWTKHKKREDYYESVLE